MCRWLLTVLLEPAAPHWQRLLGEFISSMWPIWSCLALADNGKERELAFVLETTSQWENERCMTEKGYSFSYIPYTFSPFFVWIHSVCVCLYVYINEYVCVYIYMCVCVCVCVYMCVCVCIYICVCVCVYIYVCVCVCVCIYIYILCVCVCVCVYIYCVVSIYIYLSVLCVCVCVCVYISVCVYLYIYISHPPRLSRSESPPPFV